MCCMLKRSGITQSTTNLPPHGGQPLSFIRNSNRRVGLGFADEFNYVAPVVKYAPAQMQPGPVYRSGLAAKVGHQPYSFDQKWVAYSTPKQTDYTFLPSYKGTQSTASYSVAQNTMSQLINMRSINGGR